MAVKWKAVLAEFIGMALFVYVACGSAVNNTDTTGIALTFGLSISCLVYTIGHHSGGHLNPIVTIAVLIWEGIDILSACLYILAQFSGATLGALVLWLTIEEGSDISGLVNRNDGQTLQSSIFFGKCINGINKETSSYSKAFLMEAILSFLLVWVISETAVNGKSKANIVNAPLAIGLAVFMAHIVAIPFTGASINPARSFGPMLVKNQWTDFELFLLAPLSGGILAALLARFGFQVTEKVTTSPSEESPQENRSDNNVYLRHNTTDSSFEHEDDSVINAQPYIEHDKRA